MQKRNLVTACAIALFSSVLFVTVPLLEAQAAPRTSISATPNLGIYSDPACTQNLTSFDWGKLSPNGVIYKTIYVKNLCTYQQKLNLITTNWNPTTAKGPIVLSWNIENTKLGPNQVAAANLTLTAVPSATGFTTFAVDVTVKGTSNGH